jgi:hypothetical protein
MAAEKAEEENRGSKVEEKLKRKLWHEEGDGGSRKDGQIERCN